MINNPFYLELFDIACRHSSPTESDIANKENIILEAIAQLPEGKRNFIFMLKPLYVDPDPNGVNSMKYVRKVCSIFNMKHMAIKSRKKEIRKDIINIIISLLPPMANNS